MEIYVLRNISSAFIEFPFFRASLCFSVETKFIPEIELSPKLKSIIEFGAYGLPKLPSDEVILLSKPYY